MNTVQQMQDPNLQTTESRPSTFNLFSCKCPRCRMGNMFVNNNPYALKETMKMHEQCPVCGQHFNLEVGFYYGSSYISYALAVAFTGMSLVIWWFTIGVGLEDNRIFYWLAVNALLLFALQPYLMRFARTGWLALFVRYDHQWRTNAAKRPERTNKAQESNW